MIVFGVQVVIVQVSFWVLFSVSYFCNTAIHRGHKESLYLNQSNLGDAGLLPTQHQSLSTDEVTE